jgi:hypothetical protein
VGQGVGAGGLGLGAGGFWLLVAGGWFADANGDSCVWRVVGCRWLWGLGLLGGWGGNDGRKLVMRQDWGWGLGAGD